MLDRRSPDNLKKLTFSLYGMFIEIGSFDLTEYNGGLGINFTPLFQPNPHQHAHHPLIHR